VAQAETLPLASLLAQLRADPKFMRNVTAWQCVPARPARYAPWSDGLDPRLINAARAQGIERPFTHQAQSIAAALRGENVVVVTSTASGKTLCYNLPVLNTLLRDPAARALYLFPTKALAQDQLATLNTQFPLPNIRYPIPDTQFPLPNTPYATYDGDTPRSQRAGIRRQARLLITNPDMLHTGILPHHTQWYEFFGNLRTVVIDEMHTYRGVFGSHMANLLRRLRRICAFYGAAPRYLLTSATIANPVDLAERLIEAPVTLIDDDGAPQGEKHLIFYNPPLVDPTLGIRRSATLQARDIAAHFLAADVQTILFARARLTTEVLLGYLRDEATVAGVDPERVRGYRGGYLPLERREIERGLREGTVRAVVATNALELGVDIGQLSACIMTGYPGTVASTWQQAGRAGRRAGVSVAVLVASAAPLDQFMVRHPDYFFGRSPERGLIQPDNLVILLDHLRCAAFELPFERSEGFGHFEDVPALLDFLAQQEGALHRSNGSYRWVGDGYPAARVSLRRSGPDSVLIIDLTAGAGFVIGEVDRPSASFLVHEGAIYLHQGQVYLVERLDWEQGQAFVQQTDVDYYTDASLSQRVEVLEEYEQQAPRGEGENGNGVVFASQPSLSSPIPSPQSLIPNHAYGRAFGELQVTSEAVGYRQIKRYTHETLGWGEIDLPEQTMATSGTWLWVGEGARQRLYDEGVLLAPVDYGPDWPAQREAARLRDRYLCRTCGAPERDGRQHDVHHIRPLREFGYVPGQNETYRQANALDNLITLCPRCHRRAETARRMRGALGGLAHALQQLAPLYLMCDPRDLGCSVDSRSAHTGLPTITLYDRVSGGIGLSVQLYELFDELLRAAGDLVASCGCQSGCPSCVGPVEDLSPDAKGKTIRLIKVLLDGV
jgi:DEAD/DEAH box helicase domain-containing protein